MNDKFFAATCTMPNRIVTVQECDATMPNSSNSVWNIIFEIHHKQFFISWFFFGCAKKEPKNTPENDDSLPPLRDKLFSG